MYPTGLLHSLPVIGEMSSSNVNSTCVCESGFRRGARQWTKTSEPIMFCYSTPFKCSSLPFCIRWRLVRFIAGPDVSAVQPVFVLIGRVKVISLDIMGYFLTQII